MNCLKLNWVALSCFFLCGCGSIVNTTLETKPEDSGAQVSGIPYYLPKGKVLVAGTWNKDSKQWDIKITPVIEADPSHRFLADRHRNILFDDDITVSVDPTTGLLQTVNATSTDRTTDALSALASAAASALTFGAGLGPVPSGGANAADIQKEFNDVQKNAFFTAFQVIVDDTGRSQLAYVRSTDTDNSKIFGKFIIQLSPGGYDPSTYVPAANQKDKYDGIVVREVIPYLINITADIYNYDGSAKASFAAPQQTVLLPDSKHNYCINLPRTPFVGDTTKIALVNGIVQSQQRTRPSIVMGIVGVPKTILGAIAPIPLQIRNDQLNLVTAQDKTLAAEQDIKKLKQSQ